MFRSELFTSFTVTQISNSNMRKTSIEVFKGFGCIRSYRVEMRKDLDVFEDLDGTLFFETVNIPKQNRCYVGWKTGTKCYNVLRALRSDGRRRKRHLLLILMNKYSHGVADGNANSYVFSFG